MKRLVLVHRRAEGKQKTRGTRSEELAAPPLLTKGAGG